MSSDQSSRATPGPPEADELLESFLAARDVPCPRCQYNLRGLLSPHCPECGIALALRVGPVEPILTWWIGLLIVAGLAGGFSVLCLLVTLREGLPGGTLGVIVKANLGGIFLPVLLYLVRRRFVLMSKQAQVATVVSAAALFLLNAILFFSALR